MTSGISRTPAWAWALIALLALLWHAVAYLGTKPLLRIGIGDLAPRTQMPVDSIAPAKLAEIRRRWQDTRRTKQSLLISKGQAASRQAPEDARYFSDRNIRVEKEQRARRGQEGDAGPRGTPEAGSQRQREQEKEATTRQRRLPTLGNLGVPLALGAKEKRAAVPEKEDRRERRAGTGGGADQQTLDPRNLPEGSQNLLNAQESVFYSFFARMREQLQPIWTQEIHGRMSQRAQRLGPGEYETGIAVVVNPDGSLDAVEIARGSGVTEVDQAAQASVRRLRQLPNPPQGLRDPDGKARFTLGFALLLSDSPGIDWRIDDPTTAR